MAFPWLGLLTGLGGLFGNASQAKADAKKQQSDTAAQQGQLMLGAYNADQNARTTEANQLATRPTERLQQGALGNLVEGWTPSRVSWGGAGSIPQISGGFSDLKFNDSTKQSADLMQRDALMRQMAGGQASDITQAKPVPNVTANFPNSNSSWLDKLLGIGGMMGGLAGVWQDAKTTTRPNPVPYNPNPEDPWSQNPQIPRPR
jgi:hypothetical protein